jgi:hypothetical protein
MGPKNGKPLEKQRHCSVCGLPGHTKTAHGTRLVAVKPRKKVIRRNPTVPVAFRRWLAAKAKGRYRRNLDAFTDGTGIHPIRGTAGYDPVLAGEDRYLDSVRATSPAVLKLAWPHHEATYEADALAFWGGDGAVRLLEWDRDRWAMLLERAEPGSR